MEHKNVRVSLKTLRGLKKIAKDKKIKLNATVELLVNEYRPGAAQAAEPLKSLEYAIIRS